MWPSANQPWPDLLSVVRAADAGRWHRVYLEDHFIEPAPHQDDPLLEVTGALAALAAATQRIGIGPLVMSVTYRHPAVIANWAATVDRISAGRLVLGLGAGWQEGEHTAYGLALGRPGERIDRFREALRVVRGLLDEPRTTMTGDYYQLVDAACEPKPVQPHLPILVGGRGDRMLTVVARYADEWNVWADPQTHRERAAVLDRACERLGRDPGTIWRSTQAPVLVTDDDSAAAEFRTRYAARGAVAGSVEQVAEAIRGYAEAGLDEFIVPGVESSGGPAELEVLEMLRGLVEAA